MDKFLREYNGHVFDDWGSICSDDYKEFVKGFKKYLRRRLPGDCKVIGFKPNHYDTSGFIKHGEEYVYVSTSWDRFSPLDVTDDSVMNGCLIRFAENENDYTGGTNNFVSIEKLPERIVDMFAG